MINTFVNVGTTNTLVLDLRGTEGAQSIILGNESDSDISLAFGGDEAVVGSGIILSSGEKIVYDTKDSQINVINAISTGASKKLTVFADVVTPGDIIIIDNSENADSLNISWDFTSNSDSYEISLDSGSTRNNIGNVNTYTKDLPSGTYDIIIRGIKGAIRGNDSNTISIIIL